MSIGGMLVSLAYRYASLIPGWIQKWFGSKYSLMAYGMIHLVLLIMVQTYAVVCILDDNDRRLIEAVNYDPQTKEFLNESSFIFFDIKSYMVPLSALLYTMIIFTTLLLSIVPFFVRFVRKFTQSSQQKMILRSMLIQVILTVFFQLLPMSMLFASWVYQIKNSFTTATISLCVLSMHFFVEMLFVMYSVTPYRKYLISKVMTLLNKDSNIVCVNVMTSQGPLPLSNRMTNVSAAI